MFRRALNSLQNRAQLASGAAKEQSRADLESASTQRTFVISAAILGSYSMAMSLLAVSKIRTVKLPVPGPISSTVSVGLSSAFCILGLSLRFSICDVTISRLVGTNSHNGVGNTGVFQDMLADICLEKESISNVS